MLRITLEMVPLGMEDAKYTIGTLEIAKVNSDKEFGDYLCAVKDGELREPDTKAMCKITHFPRKDGAWQLVKLALEELDIKFNPK